MKKIIPVITAIVLIFVVIAIAFGGYILDRYSYSDVKADLDKYYGIEKADEAAVLYQEELLDLKCRMRDGMFYMEFEQVQQYLNDRFYSNPAEELLLYTTPDAIITVPYGQKQYFVKDVPAEENFTIAFTEGDKLYVSLGFVQKYTNFTYDIFTEPNRIQIYKDEIPEKKSAQIMKKTAIRYQGGIKSEILKQVKEGDAVTILERMDNWSKVKSQDGLIGYVENKMLGTESLLAAQPLAQYEEPVYTSIKHDGKVSLGWHQVMSEAANSTLQSVVQNTKGMNVISPTWFSLNDLNGGFSNIGSKSYVDQAHQMGLEVWGLVDNFTHKIDTHAVLSSTAVRSKLIQDLVSASLALSLDGINLDFELIQEQTEQHYIQFIRELSIACRANQLVLSVDNPVPTESSAHYNRKEQGIVADYVIIMGYDEHWGGGGKAGSVASIGFVEDGIKRTLEEVPADKVINAIPFYTRVWSSKGSEVTSDAVGMETAEKFLAKYQQTPVWDEQSCQKYAEFQAEDILYQVWLEDPQSLEVKLNVMKLHNIAGVAVWKLGLEVPQAWDVVASFTTS